MKYLEDSRLTQLTSDLTGAVLNTRGSGAGSLSSSVGVGGVGRGRRGAAAAKGGKKKRGGGGGGNTATAVDASTVAPIHSLPPLQFLLPLHLYQYRQHQSSLLSLQ